MIVKYQRLAKRAVLIMIGLILAKFIMSVILGLYSKSLGVLLWPLNIFDAILLLATFIVVPIGWFMAPYWYGKAKGCFKEAASLSFFGIFGFIILLTLPDKSITQTVSVTPSKASN